MASEVAKTALNGEQVVVVNAEKAYVSGDMRTVFQENKAKVSIKNKGNVNRGPYHPRRPDNYVRRVIRGMLPWDKDRGRRAYKRVRVYIGVPEGELKKRNIPMPQPASPRKKLRRKVTVAEVCRHIGGGW
jgi:large subunit ribosomal protein L13